MPEVKVDLTGQVAQFDAILNFSGDEILDAFKSGTPISVTVPVAQFQKYGLLLTAQLVAIEAANPAPAPVVE